MALRPPRAGFGVARRLSERARTQQAAQPAETRDAAAMGTPPGAGGGFAGMVDALRGLAEQLATLSQQPPVAPDAPLQDGGSHNVTIGGAAARMVFGYTLRMGQDGISAEPFGDLPERAAPPGSPAASAVKPAVPARQPIVELFEEDGAIVVVAELPGADPDGIACHAEENLLLIETSGGRRYRKELALPAPVLAEGMRQSFRNGILEIRLPRKAAP